MKVLIFKKLTIISKIKKTAAQFEFSKNYNLILSKEKNSVGKSSLVKNIFWCFGCEPQFDDGWRSLDCRAILDFEVEGKPFQVARQGNRFFLKEGRGEYRVFSGTGGEFSLEISKIVNFNALLAVRDKDEVIIPPPAYYFSPFYIDQKQSWANAWSSFNNLMQFPSWKKVIIPYHTGMIKKRYFETTEEIYRKKVEKSDASKEIERFDTAISVVSEFSSKNGVVIDDKELDKIERELKVDVMELYLQQEVLFEEIATLRAEKAHVNSQLLLSKDSLDEAFDDYEYAEELAEEVECPTCGAVHDNSIASRFSLLQDKKQAENVVERLAKELDAIEAEIVQKDIEFNELRSSIDRFDEKYSHEEDESKSLSSILDVVASQSVRKKVEGTRSLQVEKLHDLDVEEKELIKDRNKESKETRKSVKEAFQEIFPCYLSKLKAFGVNSSSIKSPENHAKVSQSGGAAESTRAMLAYYVSVYKLMANYGEQVLSPLVIDTPNQHEQAAKHYESIVSLIMDELPNRSQVFICGMDSEKLKRFKEKAKVVLLDVEHSLLSENDYKKLDAEYSELFEQSSGDV